MSDHTPTLEDAAAAMHEDRRWLFETAGEVSRKYGEFATVKAATVEVAAGGALVFRDLNGDVDYIAAPGTWLTVSPEDA